MLGLKLEETRFYRETKEEGRQEALRQVVINLLNEGMTVETIARVTGLSIQQVQEFVGRIA